MPNTNYISQITLPSGSEYQIKDAWAREQIATLSTYTEYLGVTTTELVDGETTSATITIAGDSVTAKKGDIVTYNQAEFVYNGTTWQEFGDLSALGDLAYKDDASATYTPAGSVSVSVATTANQTAAVSSGEGETTYTPAGSVSLTSTEKTITVAPAQSGDPTYTPSGSVSLTQTAKTVDVAPAVGDTNFTPAGSVSLTTTEKTLAVSAAATGDPTYVPAGNVSLTTTAKTITVAPAQSGTATYTPAGDVSVSVTPSEDTVYSITDVGTLPTYDLPSLTTTVENENLTIGFSTGTFTQGTLPTKGSAQTVVSGIASATGSFSGTGARLEASVTTADSASFSGTGARLETAVTTADSASFSGTGVHLQGSVTTTDSASFSGTGARLQTAIETPDSASFSGTGVHLETGNIAVPATLSGSFTGTEATITVS